ncbi:sugar ABC transporter substrate-binding protein [Paenibacillus mucilaginosus]|nr:sugar ABC transporter substrate-binding protein [Paenibacillus caseinilyticus]MCZ8522652.1 sugar ABC transporter substrate-binding protein [Paenibacillus caseinilyticus]
MLVLLGLAGCEGDTQEKAAGGAARPFEGKSLTLITANHPWADEIKPLLPAFEEATGMSVLIQSHFEDQLTQKLTVQFTSGAEKPDVFMYRPLQEGKYFYRSGWLQPLDDYANRDAGYGLDDFSAQAIRSATVDGKLAGIPVITEQGILYYRKDLLEKAGLRVPQTIGELTEAARRLHDPEHGMYGFVARGQRSPLVTQVSSFLYSEGGDFIVDGRAAINSPQALKAFTSYGTLLREYGPPGVIHMSWPQASRLFASGQAAFYIDANSIYRSVLDPAQSQVEDSVGYAPFPAGDAGPKTYSITSWGLAMNPKTPDPEAAWAFIAWATSRETVLHTQQKGNPGARRSVWAHPEGTKGFPAELVQAIQGSIRDGVDHDRPATSDVAGAREAVGEIVQRIMSGETDIGQTADRANAALQAIIDKEAGMKAGMKP